MVSQLRLQTFSSSLLVIVFLLFGGSFHETEGFKHRLQLYFNTTAQGDFLTIETNQPNLDFYGDLFSKVKLVCSLGVWGYFTEVNYQGLRNGLGSQTSNQTECRLWNAPEIKSIRYLGASESTSDSLSLYELYGYRGTEILVEGPVYGGITTPIASLSGTGNSQWKLFEGRNLDGKSICIQVPKDGDNYYYEYDIRAHFNVSRIGSVFKGCNILEIEEYKRKNNM